MQGFKDYGFAFCVQESYITRANLANQMKSGLVELNDNLHATQLAAIKSATEAGGQISNKCINKEKIIKEIQDLMNENILHLERSITRKWDFPVYFKSCFGSYMSQEYHDEFVRIVKKYCMDCEVSDE